MEIPEASISCYAVSASSLRCEANFLVPIPKERSAPGHSLLMRLVPASHDVRSTPKADIRFQRNNLQRWANKRHCTFGLKSKTGQPCQTSSRWRNEQAGMLIHLRLRA